MGAYVSIRGWLECDEGQFTAARKVISSHEGDHYSHGWGAPRRHINWTYYLFYGANIRESAVNWFTGQLREIARISDADGYFVRGLFLASHEAAGMTEWQVREGRLFTSPADTRYQYLDE
ncbi:hypothetical protein Q3V23_01765 [Streptomyces sp. VNUA116]|uniref:hypothetical protein n=1 Tax=Streptomyces sp. VNUA116 TaxID=3062449 RepID=UPI002676551B|nr:hypothetical protein [Streptomyces sp. VNUA116]WKU42893.1 hypothetical protein Q3V23_01765 [Streptomyces sp. VNUA116]